MSKNSELFDAASLAEASYANFIANNGVPLTDTADIKAALVAKKWSSTQADEFLSHWRVAAQQPNTASGFSATLFERLDGNGQRTGEYVFANRGTETDAQVGLNLVPQDLEADLGDLVLDGLAWEQIVDMYNYWQRLTTEPNTSYQKAVLVPAGAGPSIVDQQADGNAVTRQITFVSASDGLGLLSPDALVQVTGHSLGGHLASAFARLFPGSVSQAYSINGAGYAEILGNQNIQYVFSVLGGASTFDSALMQNFYGSEGPEIVTQNVPNGVGLVQVGAHDEIFIEQGGLTLNPAVDFSVVWGHRRKHQSDEHLGSDPSERIAISYSYISYLN